MAAIGVGTARLSKVELYRWRPTLLRLDGIITLALAAMLSYPLLSSLSAPPPETPGDGFTEYLQYYAIALLVVLAILIQLLQLWFLPLKLLSQCIAVSFSAHATMCNQALYRLANGLVIY
jgi:hypothetical protein